MNHQSANTSENEHNLRTVTEDFQSPFCKLNKLSEVQPRSYKWIVCIDISGSTGDKLGNQTILETEINLAETIISNIDPEHTSVSVVKWDTHASLVPYTALNTLTPTGGTEPVCIINDPHCNEKLKEADGLLIITDGAIDQGSVGIFGRSMIANGSHLKTVVGVLVGRNYAHELPTTSLLGFGLRHKKPAEINVSVLVPAMISDSCILYHDVENTYVMWSNGAFRKTWSPKEIDESTQWSDVTKVSIDTESTHNLLSINLPVCSEEETRLLVRNGYIPIGDQMFFHPENLLRSSPNFDTIVDFPFGQICQYFKVNNRYQELIDWFKDRLLHEFTLNDDDSSNFTALVEQMSEIPVDERRNRSNPYMSVYVSARNRHIARRYIASDEELEDQVSDPRAIRVLQFFRDMIRVMEDDVRMIEEEPSSSYAVSSLATSRYTSSASRNNTGYNNPGRSNPRQGSLSAKTTVITANITEPHLWYRQLVRLYPDVISNIPKHECSICCEECVPFLLIRTIVDIRDLTRSSGESYKYFYPSLLCSRCADFFCQKGLDPVRVPCIASIPIVPISILKPDDTLGYLKMLSNIFIDYSIPTGGSSSTPRLSGPSLSRSSRPSSMRDMMSSAFSSFPLNRLFGSSQGTDIGVVSKGVLVFVDNVINFLSPTEKDVIERYAKSMREKFNL